MLKTYQFKAQCRATFIALKLQISFCQDSWQNIGERPYVYKIVFKFKCIHECWLKQLVSPSLNTTLVHVNYNKSLEKLQDFFFKTETKCSRPKPRPRLHDLRPRLSFLSSRRLETNILVSRTTSLLACHLATAISNRIQWLLILAGNAGTACATDLSCVHLAEVHYLW